MRTRDVDWAIRIGKFYIHVSSAGDDLPAAVQENLYDIWDALKSAPVLYKAEDVDAETALEVVAGVRYIASDTFRCGLEAGVYMDDLDDNDDKATGKNHLTVFPTLQVNSGKNAYFCTGVNFDTKLDTGDMTDTATVTTVTVPFIVRVKM